MDTAITCHKAQGGQWEHVYVDQGYMTDDMLTPDYIHWLYTAFTRAKSKLFLVNWPKNRRRPEEFPALEIIFAWAGRNFSLPSQK